MVDTKTIAELSDLAKQLNSKSDRLNEIIKALNVQLANLNLGLEFWLDDPIEDSGLQYDSSYSPQRKSRELTYLGYDKIDDAWQLAIKEERTVYEWDHDNQEEYPVSECEYTPLLKVSRDLRLTAIEQVDSLLEGMKEHARRKLATINRAEKLAKPR